MMHSFQGISFERRVYTDIGTNMTEQGDWLSDCGGWCLDRLDATLYIHKIIWSEAVSA